MKKKYLAHHGIKGQKWGVRRYENEDGSLTPEGKKRYSKMVKDSKQYGESIAKLERFGLRQEAKKLKPDQKLLVPSDVKNAYAKGVREMEKLENRMRTEYSDIFADVKSMDDGYDYVTTYLTDKYLGTMEYYTVIGKTKTVKE